MPCESCKDTEEICTTYIVPARVLKLKQTRTITQNQTQNHIDLRAEKHTSHTTISLYDLPLDASKIQQRFCNGMKMQMCYIRLTHNPCVYLPFSVHVDEH